MVLVTSVNPVADYARNLFIDQHSCRLHVVVVSSTRDEDGKIGRRTLALVQQGQKGVQVQMTEKTVTAHE